MKLLAAAVQMPSDLLDLSANLQRADVLLRQARDAGAELVVLPELFNTGYSLCPDFGPHSETPEGPTLTYLLRRARQWKMHIAAGYAERDGRHLYDSLAFCTPGGDLHVYRKRNLVFWERFRFHPGRRNLIVPTPWGRIGFAICADMIYDRVWQDYRGQIDLAVVSSAWPEFADRGTGRRHWLLGRVGPLCSDIPARVAQDLGVPVVFANQCGETQTRIPLLHTTIHDRFAGLSSICDGRHGEPVRAGLGPDLLLAPVTIHAKRGLKAWHFTSHSARAAASSALEPS
ncbi:carbon-nitrogen hydrolase family protein [Planctomyces sp. SH-PL62]|uniref:carbon-nitrogen hydrolase family protein n=1 Tax=Planctomyces sp. SH-PL62 TaxID=1636152 RepID=UPI00078BA21A|nr:carbon-nitrogen hydrolase family protein [Planctomyces sp. SH-PL62]AMV38536.1 (R)-stereoselective amidase [Planctomyces sp. SH-PL62]